MSLAAREAERVSGLICGPTSHQDVHYRKSPEPKKGLRWWSAKIKHKCPSYLEIQQAKPEPVSLLTQNCFTQRLDDLISGSGVGKGSLLVFCKSPLVNMFCVLCYHDWPLPS